MKTRQDVKRWLWGYRYFIRMSKNTEQDINELRTMMEGLKAQRLTGMPKGSGGTSYSLEETIDKIEKIINKRQRFIGIAMEERERIEEAIDGIEDITLKEVMYNRYILGERWEKICRKMDYSWTHIHRFHKEALDVVLKNTHDTHKNA